MIMTDLTVNVTKTIDAPIKDVFDAWLDADMLAKFILPSPGMEQPRVETDAREGGTFTIIMKSGDKELPHTGKYLAVSRPSRLVFTWESPFSTDGSTVTLNFKSVGANRTLVELNHVRFIDEKARDNHENGWGNILHKLDELLAHHH